MVVDRFHDRLSGFELGEVFLDQVDPVRNGIERCDAELTPPATVVEVVIIKRDRSDEIFPEDLTDRLRERCLARTAVAGDSDGEDARGGADDLFEVETVADHLLRVLFGHPVHVPN